MAKFTHVCRRPWVLSSATLCLYLLFPAAATPQLSSIELISLNAAGTDTGDSNSGTGSQQRLRHWVTPDGRYVLFISRASDLTTVADTNDQFDVFVRDRELGVTELISVNADGTAAGNDRSFFDAAISEDGRFVVFSSEATDLVSGITDTNDASDVFRRDRQTGTTELVSVTTSGSTPSGSGFSAASAFRDMTPDGRLVTFFSRGDSFELAGITDGNSDADGFVRDMQTGTTTLVTVNSDGTASGSGGGIPSQITPDGRFVLIASSSSDLDAAVSDTNGTGDVFLRDLVAGVTTTVSVDTTGSATGDGFSGGNPQMSLDARFVAFQSSATDLVAADGNGQDDIFVRDMTTGTTQAASVNDAGNDTADRFSFELMLSADGRFVTFGSAATDLVDDDLNGRDDVFLRDLELEVTHLVSVNRDGTGSADDRSEDSVLSADGRFVLFESEADDLVPGTPVASDNVFLRDVVLGTTTLISRTPAGGFPNGSSDDPWISGDGRWILFTSGGTDLVAAPDTNGTRDVFLIGNEATVVTGVLEVPTLGAISLVLLALILAGAALIHLRSP